MLEEWTSIEEAARSDRLFPTAYCAIADDQFHRVHPGPGGPSSSYFIAVVVIISFVLSLSPNPLAANLTPRTVWKVSSCLVYNLSSHQLDRDEPTSCPRIRQFSVFTKLFIEFQKPPTPP